MHVGHCLFRQTIITVFPPPTELRLIRFIGRQPHPSVHYVWQVMGKRLIESRIFHVNMFDLTHRYSMQNSLES